MKKIIYIAIMIFFMYAPKVSADFCKPGFGNVAVISVPSPDFLDGLLASIA